MSVSIEVSLKQNFIYQITYRILTIITPLITAPLLSRALGATNLGLFSATDALVSYFALFAMLGIENYGIRRIAISRLNESDLRKSFWNIYSVQLMSSFIAIVAYVVLFNFTNPDRKTIVLLQGITLVSCLFNVNWAFWGLEQFKIITIRNVIIKLLTVSLIIIFIKDQSDLPLYTLIMTGDVLLSNLIMFPFLLKRIPYTRPSLREVQKHIKPILVLFIPVISMSIYHVMDKTMLDILSTETELGYYYSADKIMNFPYGVIIAMGTVMLPRIAKSYGEGDKKYIDEVLKKSTELTVFLTSAIGIGIASIAKEFVPFFLGSDFYPCIILVVFFVPVLFAKSIGNLIRAQYMVPTNKDKMYIISVFVGAIVNLFANYFLINAYAALGAVIGTLIAETIVTLMNIIMTRKHINFTAFLFKQWPYLLFGMIMYCFVRLASGFLISNQLIKIIIMISVGALCYLSLCTIYWSISKQSAFSKYSIWNLLKRYKS